MRRTDASDFAHARRFGFELREPERWDGLSDGEDQESDHRQSFLVDKHL
jgi:hypothetical protein